MLQLEDVFIEYLRIFEMKTQRSQVTNQFSGAICHLVSEGGYSVVFHLNLMVGRLLSFSASAYFQVTTIDGRNAPPGMYKTIVNPGVNCKLPFPQLGELDPEF